MKSSRTMEHACEWRQFIEKKKKKVEILNFNAFRGLFPFSLKKDIFHFALSPTNDESILG